MFQGVEWIKFVLYRYWLNNETFEPLVRGHNTKQYFEEQYKYVLNDQTKKKLRYFLKFVNTNEIKIHCISKNTPNDNNDNFYNNIIKQTI